MGAGHIVVKAAAIVGKTALVGGFAAAKAAIRFPYAKVARGAVALAPTAVALLDAGDKAASIVNAAAAIAAKMEE